MGMAKSSVLIYSVLALSLLFLLTLFSTSPSHPNRRHRRLKLRHDGGGSVPFDPLISDLHAPGFEAQPDFIDDFINDDYRFNFTDRIERLFPYIDVDPADGYVGPHELAGWSLKQSRREVMRRTQREFELHDEDRDGRISFHEYQPPSWDHSSGDSSGVGWWKGDHFNASDLDGDGHLNLTEFNDFLHPADSSNSKLIQWLCEEEIRERDTDLDGKLSFQEFFRGLFESLKDYDAISNMPHMSNDAAAKNLFAQFDQDKDGYLSDIELKPIIGDIHPSDGLYAKQQAEYVLSQADADKDGRLSLQEMTDEPYVFYSAIFSDEDYAFHDELR